MYYILPQERQDLRHGIKQIQSIEGVSDDLRDGPGENAQRQPGADGGAVRAQKHSEHEEYSGVHLHQYHHEPWRHEPN
jgi:hypothetical protein